MYDPQESEVRVARWQGVLLGGLLAGLPFAYLYSREKDEREAWQGAFIHKATEREREVFDRVYSAIRGNVLRPRPRSEWTAEDKVAVDDASKLLDDAEAAVYRYVETWRRDKAALHPTPEDTEPRTR